MVVSGWELGGTKNGNLPNFKGGEITTTLLNLTNPLLCKNIAFIFLIRNLAKSFLQNYVKNTRVFIRLIDLLINDLLIN